MKCTRFWTLLVLAVLSGATVAFGAVVDEGGREAEPCPAYQSEYDSPEGYADLGADDEGSGESTCYDHGETDCYDRGETEATEEEQFAESGDGYRYEYPEESTPADQASTDNDYGYAEQYYYKYGYQYAEPEQKYGFADEYGSAKEEYMAGLAETSVEEPIAATEAGDEGIAPEVCDDACQPGRDTLAEQAPASAAAPEESQYESENYYSGYGHPYQDGEEARDEQSAAETPKTEEAKYEFDGYHPRYGYEYHRYYEWNGHQGCQVDAAPAPATERKTTDTTMPAASSVADDSETALAEEPMTDNGSGHDNAWSPATIAERYGYPEYLGEDYLWEAGISIESLTQGDAQAGNEVAADDTGDEMIDEGRTEEVADPEALVDDAMSADQDPTSEDPSRGELEYRENVETAMEDEPQSWNDDEQQYSEAEMNDVYSEPSEMNAEPTEAQGTDEATEAAWQPSEGETQGPYADSAPSSDFNYDYADPYGHYGRDYGREAEEMSAAAEAEAEQTWDPIESSCQEPEADDSADADYGCQRGMELFADSPGELLTVADQDLLQTLAALCEEPSSVRRATLCDYLETLGMDAVDFSSRFEESTGIEALALADDLPGAAAFLASYRLVEQGELGIEEGADLLRRSLQRFSSDWLEGVTEITSGTYSRPHSITVDGAPNDDQAAGRMMDVLWTLAMDTVERATLAAQGLARQATETDWLALLPAWTAERSANAAPFDAFQR